MNYILNVQSAWRCAVCDDKYTEVFFIDKISKVKKVKISPEMCFSALDNCFDEMKNNSQMVNGVLYNSIK